MGGPDRDPTLAAAKRALNAREYENVVSLLTRWADIGDAEAQFILGYLYFTEYDCRPGTAYEWLARAAQQGHAESCYYLSKFPEFLGIRVTE